MVHNINYKNVGKDCDAFLRIFSEIIIRLTKN